MTSNAPQDPDAAPPTADTLEQLLADGAQAQALVAQAGVSLESLQASITHALHGTATSIELAEAPARIEAAEAQLEGAADLLTQVNTALRVEVRVRHALDLRLAQVTEREHEARHAALHDALTGLPNRTLFHDRLRQALARATRQRQVLAVMFLDLDRFKEVNDTHGHDVGDHVLRTVARRLQAQARTQDTVSRLGGDEFLYLLVEVRDDDALVLVAQKTLLNVQQPCPLEAAPEGVAPSVTASVGIARFPRDGWTAEGLIQSADRAMYAAKGTPGRHAFAS